MDPYQQPSGPPPSNPYDFITNPGQAPKKTFSPFGGGNSMMKRLLLVLGGAVVFIIIAMVVVSLLTSGSSGNTASLKKLAAQQEELVRLADKGSQTSQDISTRSWAATAQLAIATQRTQLGKLLEERNLELSKEEQAAENDGQVDKLFEAAISNNRFDAVFREEFTQRLTDYLQLLQATYEGSNNETIRTALSDMYTSGASLLEPASQP